MLTLHKGLFDGSDNGWDPGLFQYSDLMVNLGWSPLAPVQGPQPASSNPPPGDGFGLQNESSSGAGGGSSTNGGATTVSSTTQVTTAGSGLVINLYWDSSVGSAPAGFQADVVAAAQYIESLISTSATINLDVGYGEVGGNKLGYGALGESISYLASISYSNLISDLQASASADSIDSAFLASLPVSDPTGANNYWLTTAQAKALGAMSPNNTGIDGDIGFGTSNYFTYGDTNTSGTVSGGTYDFFATVVHEITETMGRLNLVGTTQINGVAAYGLMDLTHYSAPGVRQFTQSNGGSTDPGGYASPDGGKTNLDNFNGTAGGDPGDMAQQSPDSLNAFATPGVLEPFTANDTSVMDLIGWNLSGSSSSPPQAPTGIAFAPVTSVLSHLQTQNGLAGGLSIATASEIGGVSSDSFVYSLGGTDSRYFTLSSSGTLGTGNTGVGGGGLYSITVTANDTTNGTAKAVGVNVVVGSGGSDNLALALLKENLTAIDASAPTFIYGLGGADIIDGSGMSGPLFFVGGAGADQMTGGSGPNRYEYGAASDSTSSNMDIITNFNVSLDTIDLTGIGAHITKVGALSSTATSIAAHSADWQVSGGNTYLYVNTGRSTESLSSTNMKIELQGTIALNSSNILHA